MSSVYRLILIFFAVVFVYGLALPEMISSDNDELVFLGFVIMVGLVPLIFKMTANQIKKIKKQNKDS
jgi:uncharacterized membrane protein